MTLRASYVLYCICGLLEVEGICFSVLKIRLLGGLSQSDRALPHRYMHLAHEYDVRMLEGGFNAFSLDQSLQHVPYRRL